jgi:L-alanine-DL-glutamate epimerase-like enolase superfamily enzyme
MVSLSNHEGFRGGRMAPDTPIETIKASAFTISTDALEADGTFAWDSTTLVLTEAMAGDRTGIGYSYTDAAAASVVNGVLAESVTGLDAFAIPSAHEAMLSRIRNIGRAGLAATAISAVDAALWDLKGKLLNLPVASLLGAARDAIPVYGSGGFTSYPVQRLEEQLGGWAAEGMRWVKMKVGTHPAADLERVRAARRAIGGTELFVDANGAYGRKQALAFAEAFAQEGVSWFEEPVSSDDLDGLRLIRDRAPAGMKIAAGEYGYDHFYFRRMLEAGATDVQQADATRCLGLTGFLQADALCLAFSRPLSAHCAPALHLHAALAARSFLNQEWFHDHVRIERMLFDGAPEPKDGVIRPDLSRPGLGLDFKHQDARQFAV